MSESGKDNSWLIWGGILLVFVAIRDLFRWIEANACTFAWVLAVIGAVAWFLFGRNNDQNPPKNPNSGGYNG